MGYRGYSGMTSNLDLSDCERDEIGIIHPIPCPYYKGYRTEKSFWLGAPCKHPSGNKKGCSYNFCPRIAVLREKEVEV